MADGFKYSEEVLAERERIGGVVVPLVGEDGNAFAIMGRVQRALRKAGYSRQALDEYHADSTSGDYNHLLRVAMEWSDEPHEEQGDDDVMCDECGYYFAPNKIRRIAGADYCRTCASEVESEMESDI